MIKQFISVIISFHNQADIDHARCTRTLRISWKASRVPNTMRPTFSKHWYRNCWMLLTSRERESRIESS